MPATTAARVAVGQDASPEAPDSLFDVDIGEAGCHRGALHHCRHGLTLQSDLEHVGGVRNGRGHRPANHRAHDVPHDRGLLGGSRGHQVLDGVIKAELDGPIRGLPEQGGSQTTGRALWDPPL